MDLNPIWHIHVKQGLVNQNASIAKQEDSSSEILVFFWNKFIHVRKADNGSSTLAETDAKEVDYSNINIWRNNYHKVQN